MALSVLSQASALNPGSDLWIVPDLEKSQWTAKLDWYLNFQLAKASRHRTPQVPEFIGAVVTETQLDSPYIPSAAPRPLMIASENLLPNKWVIVLPWQEDLAQWTSEIVKIWSDLKHPSLRIFLPPGQSTGSLQLQWQSHQPTQEFTVVLD